MDSLADLLKAKQLAEPDEMSLIKDYVKTHWQSDCSVRLDHQKVILSVPNSALAATVQLDRQNLIKACGLGDRQLVIRYGR